MAENSDKEWFFDGERNYGQAEMKTAIEARRPIPVLTICLNYKKIVTTKLVKNLDTVANAIQLRGDEAKFVQTVITNQRLNLSDQSCTYLKNERI